MGGTGEGNQLHAPQAMADIRRDPRVLPPALFILEALKAQNDPNSS